MEEACVDIILLEPGCAQRLFVFLFFLIKFLSPLGQLILTLATKLSQ